MSDDTPTQAFPGPDGSDLPTQRLDTTNATEELVEEKQKSRGLLIGLIIAGVLLLAAIVVLIVFLVSRGSGSPDTLGDTTSPSPGVSSTSPTSSDTPSATPTPSASQTQQPPPPATLKIDSFTVSPSVWSCNTSAPNPVPDPQLSFSWSTSNASHVYFAVGATDDAQANGQGWKNLPTDGTDADFPDDAKFVFNCPVASQTYTITAKDDGGHKVSKSVTVTNNGDKQ